MYKAIESQPFTFLIFTSLLHFPFAMLICAGSLKGSDQSEKLGSKFEHKFYLKFRDIFG